MLADGPGDGRLSFHGDRRFHGSSHYFLTNVIPNSHGVKLRRSNGNPPSEPQSTRFRRLPTDRCFSSPTWRPRRHRLAHPAVPARHGHDSRRKTRLAALGFTSFKIVT